MPTTPPRDSLTWRNLGQLTELRHLVDRTLATGRDPRPVLEHLSEALAGIRRGQYTGAATALPDWARPRPAADPFPPGQEPDEQANGTDVDGDEFRIARYGTRVIVCHAGGVKPLAIFETDSDSPERASADYANWLCDPAALAPRAGDVLALNDGSVGFRVTKVTDGSTTAGWTVTGFRLRLDGTDGRPDTTTARTGSYRFLTRAVPAA